MIQPGAADASVLRDSSSEVEPEISAASGQEAETVLEQEATTETNGPQPANSNSTATIPARLPATSGSSSLARRARAVRLVKRFSLWSGAAGLLPVPFVDMAAVAGVQIQMLRRISQIYAVPFSENRGKALLAGLAGSVVPAGAGVGTASMIKATPAVGMAVGSVVMPVVSVGATYAIGMAFIQHFTTGGTLLDFNPPDYHEFIKTRLRARGKRASAARTAAG